MTDEQTEPDQPMTVTDARLDAMQRQMDSMKADYDSMLKQYQDANRQLFAMVNTPTVSAETVSEKPKPVGFDTEKCEQYFMKAYTKRSD